MSFIEIEAAHDQLTPDELRRLAIKSWSAFLASETYADHFCDEDDPELLNALDRAIAKATATPAEVLAADEVRPRLTSWISRYGVRNEPQ